MKELALLALWIAGGAITTVLVAACGDRWERERTSRSGGAVLFEARSTMPRWVTPFVGGLFGIQAGFGSSWGNFVWMLPFFVWWPRRARVLLRVREDALEHLPIAAGGPAGRLEATGTRGLLYRVAAADVRALAWDGFDNIGIALHDGAVVPVNFRLLLARDDREPARRAILAFVERAARLPRPVPPEPVLDVAPWVVRNPLHPLV